MLKLYRKYKSKGKFQIQFDEETVGAFHSTMQSKERVVEMSTRKKDLLAVIAGQYGSYLAEVLLEKGYQAYGIRSL